MGQYVRSGLPSQPVIDRLDLNRSIVRTPDAGAELGEWLLMALLGHAREQPIRSAFRPKTDMR
jgi:hypothetical protein